MPIEARCPDCSTKLKAPDEALGKRIRCPKCKNTFAVTAPAADPDDVQLADDEHLTPVLARAAQGPLDGPSLSPKDQGDIYGLANAPKPRAGIAKLSAKAVASVRNASAVAPAKQERRLTQGQILTAFHDQIEPVRPTLAYRLLIVCVALVMIVLPLFYLALIGVVGYAVYYHATRHIVVFQHVRDARGAIVVYAGPLIVGVTALLFMIKPLFAKPSKTRSLKPLDPSREPLLFAFVDAVCQSVNSPAPSKIQVDCEVNASAGLKDGFLGVLSNELTLTIGLPLVAGLTIEQLAGVLAHEFGHFSQAAGMRLSGVVRRINFWFMRVVYERDEWDQTLVEWGSGGNNWVMIVMLVARGVVWLTRKILWLLMVVGHAISGMMLRQMEYDADRYETRMVGSEVFEATSRRLGLLTVALQGAYADLNHRWKEGRLVDDLPKLILANAAQIPKEVLAQIEAGHTARKTGIFDTHPCERDRIAHSRAEDAPGVFRLEGSASVLFKDFEGLCKASTLDHYKKVLEIPVSAEQLEPVADVVAGQEVIQAESKALERYLAGAAGSLRGLPGILNPISPATDLKAARSRIEKARQEMLRLSEGYLAAVAKTHEARTRIVECRAAAHLVKADFRIKAAKFDLPSNKPADVKAALEEARAQLERLEPLLTMFENAVSERVAAAISVLRTPGALERIHDCQTWREEIDHLIPTYGRMYSPVMPEAFELAMNRGAVLRVLKDYEGNDKNEKYINGLLRASKALAISLQTFHTTLGPLHYPFATGSEPITLARYARVETPSENEIQRLVDVSDHVVSTIFHVYYRIMGRFALVSEEVERALGLEPLEAVAPAHASAE